MAPAAKPTESHDATPVEGPVAPRASRLLWRAVVHPITSSSGGTLAGGRLVWHLTACGGPNRRDAHCPEGQRRLAANDDPEGHCLVNDACPRCAGGAASAAGGADRGAS